MNSFLGQLKLAGMQILSGFFFSIGFLVALAVFTALAGQGHLNIK